MNFIRGMFLTGRKVQTIYQINKCVNLHMASVNYLCHVKYILMVESSYLTGIKGQIV